MDFCRKILGGQVEDASGVSQDDELNKNEHGVQLKSEANDKGDYKVNQMKLF